jgi:hypothetical protein
MGFSDEIAADLQEAEADAGSRTFEWNGQSYPCLPSSLGREVSIGADGNPVEIAAALLVRRAVFPDSPPGSGQRVTFNGANFKVFRSVDIHATALRLQLMDLSR